MEKGRSPGSRRRVVQRDEGEAREAESRQQEAGRGDVDEGEARAREQKKRNAEGQRRPL